MPDEPIIDLQSDRGDHFDEAEEHLQITREMTGPGPSPADLETILTIGARVPEILAFYEDDPRGGLMVLEDLGDEMLETRLLAGDPARPLYERAIDQLAAIRAAGIRTCK